MNVKQVDLSDVKCLGFGVDIQSNDGGYDDRNVTVISDQTVHQKTPHCIDDICEFTFNKYVVIFKYL